MKNKSTLLLGYRLNEIMVERQKPNVTSKEIELLDKEFDEIVLELWDRIPSLREDVDLQPKRKVRKNV